MCVTAISVHLTLSNMDYETILETIYGDGFFQIILTFCCSLASFVMAFELQSLVFLHITPAFNCSSAALANFSQVSWINKGQFTQLQSSGLLPINISTASQQCWAAVQKHESSTLEAFACDQWEYATKPMHRTLVTDYDLICDRKYLETWLGTCIILAMASGHAAAMFTDRFSRRKLLMFYSAWECVTIILVPFAPTLPTIFIIRILRMFSCSLIYLAPCIIAELLPTRKRAIYGNLYWLPFGLGYLAYSGLAYLTRDWFTFRLYGMIPIIIYIPICLIVPESPRWLSIYGKQKEFIEVINRVARWNKVKLPKHFNEAITESFKKLDENTPSDLNRDTIIDVLRLPNMRIKALVFCLSHATIALCYFGLTTSPTYASDNIFLNVLFQGLCEIPSAALGWVLSVKLGRRISLAGLQIITPIALIVSQVLRPVEAISSSVVAIAGRLAVTTSYCISDLYVAEIYPTTVRNLGIYLTVMMGGIASAGAPAINSLASTFTLLPTISYAISCFVGAVLVLIYIPETKQCPLAQNLQQSELLRRGNEKEWTQNMNHKIDEMINLGTDDNFASN